MEIGVHPEGRMISQSSPWVSHLKLQTDMQQKKGAWLRESGGDSDKRKIKQMDTAASYEDEVREEAPVSG